jgi:hypothetical protein
MKNLCNYKTFNDYRLIKCYQKKDLIWQKKVRLLVFSHLQLLQN